MSSRTTAQIAATLAVMLLSSCTQPQQTARNDQTADDVAHQTAQFTEQHNSPPPREDVQWIGAANEKSATAAAAQPRATPANPPPAQTAQPAPAASAPLDQMPAAPAAPLPLTQQELIEQLAEHVGEQSSDTLRPYIRRAALAVFDPSMTLSEEELASLSPADRQIVQAWQQTFARLGQTLGSGTASDRESLAKLATELAEQINATNALRLRNLKLCQRVNGYGVYDEIEKYTFLAGMTHPMIVYAELENFADRITAEDRHVVELTQEIVLYNETDGLPVWRQPPVRITDESFNRRRDFFVVQIIRLSDRLTVGKYQLKVTLTDEISQQVDEATVGIAIVADPEMTK